jgi:hypothetical protein
VLVERLRRIAEVAQARADLAVALRSMIWNTDLVEALELNNLIGQAGLAQFHGVPHRDPRHKHARGFDGDRCRDPHNPTDPSTATSLTLNGSRCHPSSRFNLSPINPLAQGGCLGVAYAGLLGRAVPPMAVNLFTATQISVGIGRV